MLSEARSVGRGPAAARVCVDVCDLCHLRGPRAMLSWPCPSLALTLMGDQAPSPRERCPYPSPWQQRAEPDGMDVRELAGLTPCLSGGAY